MSDSFISICTSMTWDKGVYYGIPGKVYVQVRDTRRVTPAAHHEKVDSPNAGIDVKRFRPATADDMLLLAATRESPLVSEEFKRLYDEMLADG